MEDGLNDAGLSRKHVLAFAIVANDRQNKPDSNRGPTDYKSAVRLERNGNANCWAPPRLGKIGAKRRKQNRP